MVLVKPLVPTVTTIMRFLSSLEEYVNTQSMSSGDTENSISAAGAPDAPDGNSMNYIKLITERVLPAEFVF